jgi:hypothetical protein
MDRSLKGKSMAVPNPIPTGPYLNGERQLKRPTSRPKLRASWTATVLLSPVHGEFVNPRRNGSVLLEVSREIIRTALDLELRVFLPGLYRAEGTIADRLD